MVLPRSYHVAVSTVVKKSVSVPDVVWARAEAEAASRHTTVSAVVTEALENFLAIRRGLQAVAEWEAEHGPFTPEEIAEADAILDAAGVGIRR
jgi:predicted transcriptional regulator